MRKNKQYTPRTYYTPDEILKIRELRGKGATIKEVAEIIGRNIGSVCSACERYHIPFTRKRKSDVKWDEKTLDRLCLHYLRGDSRKMLSEEFNVSINSISVLLTRERKAGRFLPYVNQGRPRKNYVLPFE